MGKVLCIAVVWIFAWPVFAQPKLYSISVTGGGSPDSTSEDFFVATKNHHALSKKIPFYSSQTFFGSEAGGYCYAKDDADVINRVNRVWSDLKKNPSQCSATSKDYQTILSYFLGAYDRRASVHCKASNADLDGDQKSDVAGHATPDNLFSALDFEKNHKEAKTGDHLYLTLQDHGENHDPRDPQIVLGWYGQAVKLSELRPRLAALTKKGITVHLDTFACYSGGFAPLSDLADKNAPLCTVSMTDSDHMAWSAIVPGDRSNNFDLAYIDALGKGRSQLGAFACAMARDTLNRPYSSLDWVVDQWRTTSAHSQSKGSVDTCEIVTNLQKLDSEVSDYIKIVGASDSVERLRVDLLKAYQKEFVEQARVCATFFRSTKESLNQALLTCIKKAGLDNLDALTAEALGAVNKDKDKGKGADRDTFELLLATKNGQADSKAREYLFDSMGTTSGEEYDKQRINEHLKFLASADVKSLEKFKREFCCLGFNPSTGSQPEVCSQ